MGLDFDCLRGEMAVLAASFVVVEIRAGAGAGAVKHLREMEQATHMSSTISLLDTLRIFMVVLTLLWLAIKTILVKDAGC